MAGPSAAGGFLAEAAVFLGAACVAVPVFKRLGLGSVIGYLAAGVVIGPFGAGLVSEAETVVGVAEFGVVLLLFVIGLELRPARLWRLRMDIFGLGALQVVATGIVLCLIAAFGYGFDLRGALVVGLALALSSTAFAVQLMRERGALSTPWGDRAFSILLFQDLAIVPLLFLVAFLAPGAGEGSGWLAAAQALGAIAAVTIVGRYALPPLFNVVARTRADEIFTASALLVVVGSALVMEAAGLSMALGAFMAGVLLAETEFRHQLESDIEPFRGLLLGLFFMSFGMTLDLGVVASNILAVLLGAAGLYALKSAALFGLARAFGSDTRDGLRIAATLGQGGEFGFVLFAAAAVAGLLDTETRSILSAVVTLSMVLTPFAVRWAEKHAVAAAPEEDHGDMEDPSKAPPGKILVAGFGRVGQVVARIMRQRGYDVTMVDNSPRRIRMAGTFGNKVYYGDARRLDVLRSAGAEQASIIFLCIDDRDGARSAVEKLKQRFPQALVMADTYDRFSEFQLREAGADHVVRETFESAVELARHGLKALGDGAIADELIEEFRRRDAELARLQAQYGAEAGLEKLREKYSLEEGG